MGTIQKECKVTSGSFCVFICEYLRNRWTNSLSIFAAILIRGISEIRGSINGSLIIGLVFPPYTPAAIPQRNSPEREKAQRTSQHDQALLPIAGPVLLGALAAQIQVSSQRKERAPHQQSRGN